MFSQKSVCFLSRVQFSNTCLGATLVPQNVFGQAGRTLQIVEISTYRMPCYPCPFFGLVLVIHEGFAALKPEMRGFVWKRSLQALAFLIASENDHLHLLNAKSIHSENETP